MVILSQLFNYIYNFIFITNLYNLPKKINYTNMEKIAPNSTFFITIVNTIIDVVCY